MEAQQAKDDLAFMRALVSGKNGLPYTFGLTYFLGGLIYGVQTLLHGAQGMGWIEFNGALGVAVAAGPTVLFLALLTLVLWRERRDPIMGVAQRMLNNGFAVLGATNGALAGIFAIVALREQNLTLWLMFPIVVFALQGASWLLAHAIVRRPWLLAIAIGWFATAAGMGLTIGQPSYVLMVAGGLLCFMAIPGLLIMRMGRTAS